MNAFTLPQDSHTGYVHLQVRDLGASLAYYQGRLGLLEKGREGSTSILSARPDGPPLIYLTARPDAVPKPRRTVGLYHVAIRFPDRMALGKVFQRLIDTGWPIDGAADHLVSEALYMSDPDGNGLELYRDRPRQEWPVQNGQVQMSSDPLNFESLLQEAGPSPWSGIDPGTDIGHIHIQVSDLGRAEAFYSGLLGLEVTQRSYPGALFMSAGGYHHHIGMNIWSSRGAPRPPENATGLLSFLLEIPGEEQRAELIERLRQAGIGMSTPPVSDRQDRVLIFDPDGNGVQI
jgi:catechol 2,3-dioxygenase